MQGTASDDGSGVAAVEWRLGDDGEYTQIPISPGAKVEWRVEVPIPGPGEHVIQLRCRDRADRDPDVRVPNEDRGAITIQADDNPEVIDIVEPRSPHRIILRDGGFTLEVQGKASDDVMDLRLVEWSLNEGDYEPAQPLNGDDWTSWRFSVHFARSGLHTIKVRARDVSRQTSAAAELIVRAQEVV